jgi:hypothetical protein
MLRLKLDTGKDQKDGARVKNLRPEILLALIIADGIYQSFGILVWHVTELTGGNHMSGSLHYRGLAADLRLPSQYSTKQDIDWLFLAALKAALGPQYDCVLEPTHVHVEFDPDPGIA